MCCMPLLEKRLRGEQMTADKATGYLDYLLKQHPRIEHADFGDAIKLGREALKEVVRLRSHKEFHVLDLLPGEDPQ